MLYNVIVKFLSILTILTILNIKTIIEKRKEEKNGY